MRKGSRKQRWHKGRHWEKRAVAHARARLGQRYDIHVSEQGYREIVQAIQERRDVRMIYRQSRRIAWWLVEIGGWKCIAVYDAYCKRIPTFLGLEALATIGLKPETVLSAPAGKPQGAA